VGVGFAPSAEDTNTEVAAATAITEAMMKRLFEVMVLLLPPREQL
jgi:hypothetical protein